MRYGKTYTTTLNFSSSSLCMCAHSRSFPTNNIAVEQKMMLLLLLLLPPSTFRARDTLFSVPSAFSPLLFSFFCHCRARLAFHNVCWCAIKLENMLIHSTILSDDDDVRSVVFLELISVLAVVALLRSIDDGELFIFSFFFFFSVISATT